MFRHIDTLRKDALDEVFPGLVFAMGMQAAVWIGT
jgi:hypothetical protein